MLTGFGESLAQTTYYVSPTGSDAASGRSLANAFQTFGHGLRTLAAGDTLLLADGIYAEPELVLRDLHALAERPTVVKSINPWGAKVEGVVYHAFLFLVQNCTHAIIDGLEVYHPGEGYDQDWSTGISVQTSDYVTVRNCYVHDCGCGGFGGRTGDYLTFEDNVAVGNARDSPYNCSGISIYHPRQLDDAPGPHIIVRRNVTFGNACRQPFSVAGFSTPTDGNGIILDDYANDQADIDPNGSANPAYRAITLVEGNISFGNGGAGIKTYKVPRAIVRHNTAYHNNYVLADFGGSVSEIGFEDVDGPVAANGNIGVTKFGRRSNAFYYAPWAGKEAMASLSAKQNTLVGAVDVSGTASIADSNALLSVDRQSYPAFYAAVDTVRAFASIDELRARFVLREDSPAAERGAFAAASFSPEHVRELRRRARAAYGDVAVAADPVLRADIVSTPEPVRVDGRRDGYYQGEAHAIAKQLLDTPTPTQPTATWWGAFDQESLYVLIDVEDESVGYGDFVTLLVSPARDTGSRVQRFTVAASDPALERGTVRQLVTPAGYALELALPWVELGFGAETTDSFAIDVLVQDGGSASASGQFAPASNLAWRANAAGSARDASRLGTAVLREVEALPAVGFAPAGSLPGDRRAAVWASAPEHTIAVHIAPSVSSPADLSGSWRALWDAEALHVLVDVRDDTLRQDSEQWFEDDGLEVYLDADNAKTFNGYDPNDYQLTLGLDGVLVDQKGQLGLGATGELTRTPEGYTALLRLPWNALGITPEPGTFLGFDVHLVDDDAGGPRDGKLSWHATIDQSYKNAALFGTVVLRGE